MKRLLPFIALVLASLVPLSALDVAQAEIEGVKGQEPAFVNYEGPHSTIDSLDAIRGIGQALARALPGMDGPGVAGDPSRYSVIRAIDPSVKEGFDADIILIGPAAGVDHVKNLRWIIAGYLETAYGYSRKDAYVLATFVTVYNAVYRGKTDYLATKYKAAVMSELDAANAGLSLRWDEWAGKSRILIPLGVKAAAGGLGAVDTSAVASQPVVESMRAEPGMGVADRQGMVDLKEREAAEQRAQVERSQAEIAAEEARLAQERARLEEERRALEAQAAAAPPTAEKPGTAQPAVAPPAAKPEASQAAIAPAPAAKPAATAPAATAPAATAPAVSPPAASDKPATAPTAAVAQPPDPAKEAELAAAEAALAERQAALDKAKEEAAAQEAAAAAKEAEAAAERAQITADQQAAIAAQVAEREVEARAVYLLEVLAPVAPIARIVAIDVKSGRRLRASEVNSIVTRGLQEAGGSFYAIAGRLGGTGAIRCVRIGKEKLDLLAEGADDIFPDSLILALPEGVLAVAKGPEGDWRLALFDLELKLVAMTDFAVNPYGAVAAGDGGLVVQAATGGFVLVGEKDLKKVKDIAL